MAPRGKQASGLRTQQKMLRSAVTEFLAKGYDRATTADISRGAGMTPSSFFRAYPSKEAILLEFVKWIFASQYDLAQSICGSDDPSLVCAVEGGLEIHTAELSEPLRELYVAAYSLPSTSEYIYKVMAQRLYEVFKPYQPEALPKDVYELEIATASMMRGYIALPCDMYFTVEDKISRFLDCSLKIFNVEKSKREELIATTLAMDLHTTAEEIVRATVQKVEEGRPIIGALIDF